MLQDVAGYPTTSDQACYYAWRDMLEVVVEKLKHSVGKGTSFRLTNLKLELPDKPNAEPNFLEDLKVLHEVLIQLSSCE